MVTEKIPRKLEKVVALLPQLVDRFNKLMRSKKDEIFSAYFRALDRNRDGTVDHDEFELAVKFIQPGSAEVKIEQLFMLFDVNKDGMITHQEAQNVLSSLVDLMAELSHIVIDIGIKLLNEDIVEDMTWALVMEYGAQGKEGFNFEEFKVALDHAKKDLMRSFTVPTTKMRDYPDLFDYWQGYALKAGCSMENVEKWWKAILHNYTLPSRTYHNMHHLRDIFRDLKDIEPELENPLAVGLSVFFHEIVYEPAASDNELASSELAQQFAYDVDLSPKILKCMLSIIDHGHDVGDGPEGANPDIVYFMDLKLAVLGRDPELYGTYVQKIREEYSFLTTEDFLSSRAGVLARLLETRIFNTSIMSTKYEERARRNVARELEALAEAGY